MISGRQLGRQRQRALRNICGSVASLWRWQRCFWGVCPSALRFCVMPCRRATLAYEKQPKQGLITHRIVTSACRLPLLPGAKRRRWAGMRNMVRSRWPSSSGTCLPALLQQLEDAAGIAGMQQELEPEQRQQQGHDVVIGALPPAQPR